ncbi:MAG: P1 family peptidase [Candidatus Tectomicrobia bacterium]|uniref:P1 family peptidase n=1 Tax=Tectimicrobiota bacterium TaxID=2528274 RepID=A0A932FX93_UNCTE|nr:P1 family peptidase [Candidatus Tectomicrobia bacterium]
MYGSITDIEGIKVGHASDFEAYTGCTVILCEKRAVGGVDVRGTAAGTRQVNALGMLHIVDEVNAILLAGGSAYGLDAAGGVMQYLEEQGRGFKTTVTTVPIVPTANIFDLTFGSHRVRPDKEMGYQACLNATGGAVEEGSVGAGTGATVGKLYGPERATKGGIGTASIALPNGVRVAALVVVNAFGDVLDAETSQIIAGTRESPTGRGFVNSTEQMMVGPSRNMFLENTTLGVVVTNVALTKNEAHKVAQMSNIGYARTISPVHTTFDGDVIFTLSLGEVQADVNSVGLLGAKVITEAVMRGVKAADGFGIIPAYKDLISG